jgi:radical SAM superfamily enzyme YgiQ (UPF0313 family)
MRGCDEEPAITTAVEYARLERWMTEILAKERWFVEPPHHVPKVADAVSVGILSHFMHEFTMVALGGMSLFHRINRDPDCPGVADRVFVYDPLAATTGQLAPGVKLDRPLTTLERRLPLRDLELICVSLTNPDAVTTALNLLALGGVPWRREERKGARYPLILAGGPGCCNPEPFADHFDLFCIGDGRTLTARVVEAIHGISRRGEHATAEAIGAVLSNVKGLYVPARYTFGYVGSRVAHIDPGDAVALVQPGEDPAEIWAQSSLVSNGDTAVIVPNYGCKHSCAYCQISEVNYQQFGIEPLLEQVEKYLADGISTLIVNSATLTQHSDVNALLSGVADCVEACGRQIRVYIGSVRFDEVEEDTLAHIGRLHAFSHTYLLYTNGAPAKFMALAPEHGSHDLMRRLFRPVDPWRILDTVKRAAKEGVHHFVLYFIVGFESETIEDRDKISALTAAILDEIAGAGGKVILKINPLIPTPGTTCQRMAMPSIERYAQYLDEVTEGIVRRVGAERYAHQVELVPLPEPRLVIESLIGRADRRIGVLIERLAEHRARGVEPAKEDLERWAEECGLDCQALAGARAADETLPWQVVDRTSPRGERHVLRGIRNRVNA